MIPSFEIFGRTIYTYAVIAIIGMIAAGFFICRRAGKAGLDVNRLLVAMTLALVGAFVGMHLLYGLTNVKYFHMFAEVTDIKSFIETILTLFGGSVFYGGLLGGIAAALIYFKRTKLPLGEYADIIAPGVPLFHGISRVGCFLAGCCYGIESKIGFVYHKSPIETANGVCRFPVQLLETVCNMLIFLLLWKLQASKKLKGGLFPLYLMLYAVVRFFDEFLRGDTMRGFVGAISTSQFISILMFTAGGAVMILRSVKSKKQLQKCEE